MWHDSLNRSEGRNKFEVLNYFQTDKGWKRRRSIKDYRENFEEIKIQEGLKHSIKEIGAKNNKFKELAEKRVKNALKQIQLTGNLSNKYSYDYSEGDVNKILCAIDNEIMTLKAKFKSSPEKKSFKL